jgi:hypothetical protein
MYLPTDLYKTDDAKPIKVKLLKSLYGLKQAGERWKNHLNELFIKNNFKRSIINTYGVYLYGLSNNIKDGVINNNMLYIVILYWYIIYQNHKD